MRHGDFTEDEEQEYQRLCDDFAAVAASAEVHWEVVLHALTTTIGYVVSEDESPAKRAEAMIDVFHMLSHKFERIHKNGCVSVNEGEDA